MHRISEFILCRGQILGPLIPSIAHVNETQKVRVDGRRGHWVTEPTLKPNSPKTRTLPPSLTWTLQREYLIKISISSSIIISLLIFILDSLIN